MKGKQSYILTIKSEGDLPTLAIDKNIITQASEKGKKNLKGVCNMNEKERQEVFELIRFIYNLPEEKQKELYYITEGAKFIAEKEKSA